MKLKENKIKVEQMQSSENYEQNSLNQLKNNRKQKLNNKWNKIASRLKRNWLLKIEFFLIILLLGIAVYLLDVVGNKIYQVISKGTTTDNNVHLELAIIINKNHEQYIYAKSLKDPFFLLKSGLFNVLSMTTDVFYATLKTSINESSIFIGNLFELTKLLRIYQIIVATIFIVIPLLFFLFFVHILRTLFRKIAIISKILVENNIGQLYNNETYDLEQKAFVEKSFKVKPIKEKTKKPKVITTIAFPENLDSPYQQINLNSIDDKLVSKMDLENKRNNDTINSDKKNENKQHTIGSVIYIDGVAYDIIQFQKRKQKGKVIEVALARNTKTGEIINLPHKK